MINRTELPSPRAVWVFLGVVEAGGFRKGAALLGMAQPVVSSTIRRLEEDLGLTLFVEVGRRKVLSPAGKEFLAVARPALDEWARIEDRVKEALEGRPRGCLRVGAGESSLLYLLPKPVSAFRRRCPEVELQLVSQPHEESLTMLREGSLDLAVRSLSRPTPGMSSQALRRVRRVFITARSNGPTFGRRPAVAELAELPFVLPHRKSTTRAALEGALAGRACRVALEALAS